MDRGDWGEVQGKVEQLPAREWDNFRTDKDYQPKRKKKGTGWNCGCCGDKKKLRKDVLGRGKIGREKKGNNESDKRDNTCSGSGETRPGEVRSLIRVQFGHNTGARGHMGKRRQRKGTQNNVLKLGKDLQNVVGVSRGYPATSKQ